MKPPPVDIRALYHILESLTARLKDKNSSIFGNNFTRNPIFTPEIIFCVLIELAKNQNTKGYSVVLNNFFWNLSKINPSFPPLCPTAAAFCKARDKVPWPVYYEYLQFFSELLDQNMSEKAKWKGHKVLGVDGTRLNLPASEELKKRFHQIRQPLGLSHYPQCSLLVVENILTGSVPW